MRIEADADTVLASARPGTTAQTIRKGWPLAALLIFILMPAKPEHAERMNPFPTTIDFGADGTSARGTGKPVPYMVAVQNSASHLRYARQLRFSPLFRTGFTQKPYR